MSFFGSSDSNFPPVIKNIIIINVIVFLATLLPAASDFMTNHLALYSLKSPKFEPHQVVTHMFMHAGIGHIFFNMFGVFMFGRVLEQVWGSKKMLIFYTVTGLGAAAIHLTVNYIQMNHMMNLANDFIQNPTYLGFDQFVEKHKNVLSPGSLDYVTNFMQSWFYKPDDASFIPQARQIVTDIASVNLDIPTVGASGAVFGLLVAFAMLFPDVELMLIFLPIPIKAKYFIPVYALLELFLGVANFKGDNIAHFAHLGGALFGFLLVKYWKRNQFRIY
jgi:membrane associated rhomboid family serine protease